MNAIPVDSAGHAGEPRMLSPKAAGTALVLLGSLGLAGLGVYWLAAAPADPAPAIVSPKPATQEAAPAPAETEALLTAPPATCVDGRPASEDVAADACS